MTAELPPAELARLKRELEERRAKLRIEVKTQLDGSDDDRVVGLRNRIKESGDEWGVADGLAELDIAEVRHALTELNEVEAALARMRGGHVRRMPRLRRADRARAAVRLSDRDALPGLPGAAREEGRRSAAHRRLTRPAPAGPPVA